MIDVSCRRDDEMYTRFFLAETQFGVGFATLPPIPAMDKLES
jgi:hypothetical protein